MEDDYIPPLGLDYYKILNQEKINLAFLFAVGNKDWNLSNFLLFDSRIPFNADIYGVDNSAFKFALMDKDKERLEFLIFKLNIEKNPRIIEILNIFLDETASSNNGAKLAESMFQARDLNSELKSNNTVNKAHKL